jgi:glyoxylase-like metal-dependent hydrolase (beta-lactamase superfamily II)
VSRLREVGHAQSVDWHEDFHAELEGTAVATPWHTDGHLAVVTLRESAEPPEQ